MTDGIASLPMYATRHNAADWDAFWGLIRTELQRRGVTAPSALSQPTDLLGHWCAPDLVLSQTCSKPYRDALLGRVQLVGTLDFGLEGCPPGYYRSAIIGRVGKDTPLQDRMARGKVAINGHDSQSGAVIWQRLGVNLDSAMVTGAHLLSAKAVAEGRADLAAIDAQTWRQACAEEELTQKLDVLDWTKPVPGLPLIAALGQPVEDIAAAIGRAVATMPEALAGRLGIVGWVRLPDEIYSDGSAF